MSKIHEGQMSPFQIQLNMPSFKKAFREIKLVILLYSVGIAINHTYKF